jgi:hypothetical protein
MAMRKYPPLSRFGTASDDGRKVRNIRQSTARDNYTIGTTVLIVSYRNGDDYHVFVAAQHDYSSYGILKIMAAKLDRLSLRSTPCDGLPS